MNLLPKAPKEFVQTEYWDTFFQKRGKKLFDWYGEYPELCDHLHKYIKTKDEILNVGCGNSRLCMDMYDVGYRNILNIDISQLVINQMLELNKIDRPDLKFQQMDALNMSTVDDGKFSVVIDKSTLDALMPNDSVDSQQLVCKYWSEIGRVLRVGGRYVCITLLQKHILDALLEFFTANNCWMFRVVRCIEAETKTLETNNDGTSMPIFIVIATKFQKLPSLVLEYCMAGDKMIRANNVDEIKETVSAVQKAAMVCNGLHRGNIADMDEVSIDLYRPTDTEHPRFTVHILDQRPKRDNGRYAAFIVPQGREAEWLFSTPEGRKKLLLSANHDRLAIVSMHRDQVYTTWDDVKEEISDSIKNLAPNGLKNQQIPYLSLGTDVGKRETIFKGKSQLSGDYIVEEVKGDSGRMFRRLVFLNNQFVVQSEALLKIVKDKNKKVICKEIEPSYLACQHHLYMSLGVNYIKVRDGSKKRSKNIDTAIIGLGGGGLCTFLHRILKTARITAVDIDPAMLTIATNYFGLKEDERLKVVIDDGIEFLEKAVKAGKSYKAILFDVDNKDPSVGMSFPSKEFLSQHVMEMVKTCIKDNGVFVLNLVCRNDKLHDEILIDLKKIFESVISYKLDEEVNEILYCQNTQQDLNEFREIMGKTVRSINDLLSNEAFVQDLVDLEDFINDLKL